MQRASEQADAVITSGGVSVGDADYTRDVWRSGRRGVLEGRDAPRPAVGVRPHRRERARRPWLFALPGNPVAALVTFYVFVRDALLALAGAAPQPLPLLQARSTVAIRKRPGRSEFQRGSLSPAPMAAGRCAPPAHRAPASCAA